jgi:anti-sigma regulatory factor (Ser/Thr protein kinase)
MGEDDVRPTPDVTFAFEHDVAAPRQARNALRPLFPQPDPLADEVELVASEFVSNVIRHTDEGGQMDAWDDDPLRLEVHDTDPTLPVSPDHADERGGRGLRIVNEIADEWGADRDEVGKTVWAEFRRRTAAEPVADTGEFDRPNDRPLSDDEH